jgi:hypothetical protein
MIVTQILRLASAATKLHLVSGAVKLAAKAGKFLFHSNVGLLALSALMSRLGM